MNQLKYLIDRFYQIQKHRIGIGNEIFQLKEAEEDCELMEKHHKEFCALEQSIQKDINFYYKRHEMYPWLKSVKGVGPILGAALVTLIDIERAQHASSVWKYAGLAPDQKRKAGDKLDYNPFLKTICWKLGKAFVKTKGEYRQVYDTSKLFYQKKFPEPVRDGKKTNYTKGHIDNMAMRRTVKLFLVAMWAEWRKLKGLPVSVPFAERIGKH